MSSNEYEGAAHPTGPDPALQRLDRFVGTWEVHGRTLGADEDNVFGCLTFEWLPGKFFLQQRVQIDFAGLDVRGLEVIGYDPAPDVGRLAAGCGRSRQRRLRHQRTPSS